jgi:hypothetical protein
MEIPVPVHSHMARLPPLVRNRSGKSDHPQEILFEDVEQSRSDVQLDERLLTGIVYHESYSPARESHGIQWTVIDPSIGVR